MHIFHIETLSSHIFKNSIHYTPGCIRLFFRMLDDYFFWSSSEEVGKEFMKILNSQRKSIKIDHVISEVSAIFLDLTIFKGSRFASQSILDTKAYSKPMNKHLFLPPTSFHLPSILCSWIDGYVNRLRLLCSSDTDFNTSCESFYKQLMARGHGHNDLEAFKAKLMSPKTREVLLHQAQTNLANWKNKNQVKNDIANPSIRFPLTYDMDTRANLSRIKTALEIPKDLSVEARKILGSKTSINLSVENSSSLKSKLVSNNYVSLEEDVVIVESEHVIEAQTIVLTKRPSLASSFAKHKAFYAKIQENIQTRVDYDSDL